MMSIDMAVTAALCLAIPLVTRSAGPRVLAPLLTVIGLSQGPLIPANQVLKRNWLRDGPSKALILRLMAVPPMISDILADTVYPILCVSFGWQAMRKCSRSPSASSFEVSIGAAVHSVHPRRLHRRLPRALALSRHGQAAGRGAGPDARPDAAHPGQGLHQNRRMADLHAGAGDLGDDGEVWLRGALV